MRGLGYIQKVVLRELEYGSKSKNRLIEETGYSNSAITNCLRTLIRKGSIKKNEHMYELPS